MPVELTSIHEEPSLASKLYPPLLLSWILSVDTHIFLPQALH